MKYAPFLACCVLLTACKEESVPLTGPELADLVRTPQSISFVRTRITGTATLHVDHTFDVTVPLLGSDAGRWWLDGDQICSAWAKLRQGRTLCARVGRLKGGDYVGLHPKSGARLGRFSVTN